MLSAMFIGTHLVFCRPCISHRIGKSLILVELMSKLLAGLRLSHRKTDNLLIF